ncbi:phospho-N-acetylmuramoyl-pentapeptide-transferase [candidate division KSB1 bacterium]|nr:phospho-N-acetylmuramoyl-pentapeptide-transferase [candidate division KSB1 bacterium]
MLYHLLYGLREHFIGFNLFGYITFRSAAAAVTALIVTFLIGPIIIRWLQRKELGEEIRNDGPETHHVKAGTPTMGGIIILIAILVPVLLFARLDNLYIQLMIGGTVWMGLVGFLDDWLKVVKKMPKGLVGRYKLAGQIAWGLVVGLVVTFAGEYEGVRWYSSVPFFKNLLVNFGWFYIPMVIFVITATSNAVNLTDGLDGLAIGLIAIATIAWAGVSYVSGRVDFSEYLSVFYLRGVGELTIYCAALIGASLGFLWYNSHPASVFMGDTGALALGTAMGTLAVLLKKEMLLPIVGGVFVAEVVSVILQVGSYKWRGKRIFKMAPLHHHFELLGWPEEKVVARFWIIGIVLALITLGTFKVR